MILFFSIIRGMKRKHEKTLKLIFKRPVSGNIKWTDIEGLFKELGGKIKEREGSRVAVVIFKKIHVYHRPHGSTNTDKSAIASIRELLKQNGVTP